MANLYRKRLVPEECIHLKGDVIVEHTPDIIVSKWDTLKPKAAFSKGISCYVINRGFKISKLLDSDGNFVNWYCDIIKTDYDAESDSYIFTDLLADVIIDDKGLVKVVDLDEFKEAYNAGLIDTPTILSALTQLDELLGIIYSGSFSKYTNIIDKYTV